jgi:hypothetical protein
MTFKINAYQINNVRPTAKIKPMSVKRDWIEPGTQHGYAYSCFPVVLANTMGYEIYFEEDIEFIWNGKKEPNSTTIIQGKDICYFDRGFATVGLVTNLVFKSDENTSLFCGPMPNQFIDGIQGYSAIMSTSFFGGALHIVLRITKANQNILIKAGTPIGFVLPISLKSINNSVIEVFKTPEPGTDFGVHSSPGYNEALAKEAEKIGRTVGWYQKGLDHLGNKVGNHEIKKFNFSVIEHE